MSEEELRALITTAIPNLAESVPNKTLVVPSFMLDYGYLESGNEYENGTCVLSDTYVQIDLYYSNKTAFGIAKDALKRTLITNKLFADLESYFDTTSKYYRATFKVIVAHEESEDE